MDEVKKLYTVIQEFENVLDRSLILGLFLFGKKRLFISCLEKIYLNLPSELKEKKDYLMSEKKGNVFLCLYQIQDIVNSRTFFNNFVCLHKSKRDIFIDLIYAALSEDIAFVRGNS